MYYPDEVIEEVRMKNDIVDVISGYVKLQKKGANYFGLCPFHNEKSPSFSVSPGKQMYYCFGCGAGGNVITFLMEYENYTFQEALSSLADRAGVNLPKMEYSREAREQADLRARLLEVNKLAANYFYYQMKQPQGKAAYDYFHLKRGLADEIIVHFGLGYSNKTSDDLYRYLKGKGYEDSFLKDTGLVTLEERGGRDKFWNRVMFPIMDVNNRVIGFGGRVMGDGEPKYLNSPETKLFDKSRNLYGLNYARLSREGYLLICEGYLDVISLHQAGFTNAVASLGTAFTSQHANVLKRYTDQVILTYDSDGAGVKAALRAIPILKEVGMSIKVLNMKPYKDPDEFIKQFGRDAFLRLLDQSENQVDYRLEQIRKKYDLSDDSQKVGFLQEAAQLLSSLPSAVEREIYGRHAAETAGVSPEAVAQEVKKAFQRRLRKEQKQQERRDLTPAIQLQPKSRGLRYENIRSARAEEGVLRLLLLDPSLHRELTQLRPEEFSSPLLGKAYALLLRRAEEGLSTQLSLLAGELTGEEMDHLTQVASSPESMANSRQSLADYIAVIRAEAIKRSGASGNDLLLAAQRSNLEKKAYMEEKP